MKWLSNLTSRFNWSYIGSARAETHWTQDGKNTGSSSVCYFLLSERGDGKRKFSVSGDKKGTQSEYGRAVEASVNAWVLGGPLPQLSSRPAEPKPKPRAKLIAFPGGKAKQD